ncbi:BadF/BadG/BcrA/BcrD ATPase family protein [Pseudogracilibacillus sp. SE30717A]|uniref:N-acetylglucosamine kinase n=1 Tax=Pseudogracilibacillus sp. SE30717A TaxID=3098293 RepID=UPI00300DC2DB
MDYVIGIDGGGTKTAAVLADLQGKIVAKALRGPTNPNLLCKTELQATINQLLNDLKKQAPFAFSQTVSIFAGMSGVGTKKQQAVVSSIITNIVEPSINVQIKPDPVNALYSGTYGKPGVVQIAGTGSVAFGINGKGESTRLGGWGYLFGDEGSGYDIGRRAIIKVVHAEDGLEDQTLLKELLLQHFEVADVRQMVEKVYHADNPKNEISSLSKIVFTAYKQLDLVAADILENVSKIVVSNLLNIHNQLFSQEQTILAVLAGGVFNDRSVLPLLVKKELEPNQFLSIVIPEIPPVAGSVIGALIERNIIITNEIINNLQTTLSNA